MRTKYLLLPIMLFFSLVFISAATFNFGNYVDVIRDDTLAGNQYLQNSTVTAGSAVINDPYKWMPTPKFDDSIFFPNIYTAAAKNQFENNNGSQYFNQSGTNTTLEFWMWSNESKQTDAGRMIVLPDSGVEIFQVKFNELQGIGLTGQTKGNITVAISLGNPVCGGGQADNVTLSSKNYYNDSTWHHVAIVMFNVTNGRASPATEARLFVDGGLQDSEFPVASNSCSDAVQIGGTTATGAKGFYGSIDEVRISSTARYYDNFSVPVTAFGKDTNTIALWHFDNFTTGTRISVLGISNPFINFSTRYAGTTNQFWMNITNASIATIEITPPNSTVFNLSMTEASISNMSVLINPSNTGTYNITRVFASNATGFWNVTKFSGLTWTISEDLVFLDEFLNLTAVIKGSPNQFWIINRNATSVWFEVTAPNATIFNFSTTQVASTDNFTSQMTFSTKGEYNLTKIFAQNSFTSNWNTTTFGNLNWDVSNSTNIFACDSAGLDQHVAVNFTFKSEINRTTLNISKFEATFITQDLTNATGAINITVTKENVKYVAICIQPDDHDLQTNATIKYQKVGYNFRNWHFVNENLSANQQNTTLYLLDEDKGTAITIQVTDSLDSPEEGAVTQVQRYYIGNNTFTTIGMIKAGNDGKDLIYLHKDEGDYRFRVLVDGVQRLLTTEAKVTSTSLILKIFETALADLIKNLGSITSSLSYNNDTNIVTFTFDDPNSIIQSACVEATRHNQSGRYFFGASCLNNTFSSSIELFTGNGTGVQTIIGAGYVIIGKLKYTVDPTSFHVGENSNVAVWGVFGAFVLFFVLLAAIMTQVHNPVALLAMFMLALIGTFFLGIYSMPWGVLAGLIAAIVIIMTQLRS